MTEHLTVTDVTSDRLGGFSIVLDKRFRLVAFPCATQGEHWRLFQPDKEDRPHLAGA